MIRGTILLIGKNDRATELFAKRLEREHFAVVLLPPQNSVISWLKKNVPQAILCTEACSDGLVSKVIRLTHYTKRLQPCPVIYVSHSDIPATILMLKGLGEVFRLHQISLKEATERLSLAIQLKQCVAPSSRSVMVT